MTAPARLYLVRHGEAASRWTEAGDPGLSHLGRAQAQRAAEVLARLGAMPVLSSPLKRAQETAAPTAASWNAAIATEARVTELPSPGVPLAERQDWLLKIMRGGWGAVDAPLAAWRRNLLDCLASQKESCAIFTHFVAINAAVGAATNRDDVICFRPDNASITVVEADGGRLRLIRLGEEATTAVR